MLQVNVRRAKTIPLETQAERVGGRYKDEIAEAFFDPLPEAELDAWENGIFFSTPAPKK
jgi:hypothetical protein